MPLSPDDRRVTTALRQRIARRPAAIELAEKLSRRHACFHAAIQQRAKDPSLKRRGLLQGFSSQQAAFSGRDVGVVPQPAYTNAGTSYCATCASLRYELCLLMTLSAERRLGGAPFSFLGRYPDSAQHYAVQLVSHRCRCGGPHVRRPLTALLLPASAPARRAAPGCACRS